MTDFEPELLAMLDNQLLPALFAISLMHCRNVQVEQRDPPAALSRKAQRRGGLPLTRYHVLEISAMRRVLDNEGRARTNGLGSALHICRGHFKTFTAEAPLFGKHVGRYFWHDVARGSPERGAVTTDYTVTVDDAADTCQIGLHLRYQHLVRLSTRGYRVRTSSDMTIPVGERMFVYTRSVPRLRRPGNAQPPTLRLSEVAGRCGGSEVMSKTDEILTADEAAVLLKVSTKTVLRLARDGELPCSKVGRAWRFVRGDLLRYCAGQMGERAS